MSRSTVFSRLLLGSTCFLLFAGCSVEGSNLTTEEQLKALGDDMQAIFGGQKQLEEPLTLADALARGISYNMEHRVAARERMVASGQVDADLLNALPAVNAGVANVKRDDAEIRSATNADTGVQSLPPSVFSEDNRRLAQLEASWNILDAGLAVAQATQSSDRARIAEEQRRKVVHQLTQDIRTAYWRAASAQVMGPRISNALHRNQMMVKDLQQKMLEKSAKDDQDTYLQAQRQLLRTADDLMTLQSQMSTAKIELAGLINLPPGADYTLAVNEGDILNMPDINRVVAAPEDLELVALTIRPEIRQDMLASRISASQTRATALSALPGLQVAYGYNYDSDDFLRDNNWTEFSLSLTGNLMKLLTLPVRMEQSENREKLVALQRQAKTVSILTQVNLARQNLRLTEDRLGILRNLMRVENDLVPEKADQAPLLTTAHTMAQEQTALNARARFHMAYADYQSAYGRLLTSVGIDPLPPAYDPRDIQGMARVITARTETLTPSLFGKLVTAIRTQMPDTLAGTAQDAMAMAATEPAAAPMSPPRMRNVPVYNQ
ncbi:MAG: TolC family protein [Pseudomonadota bacterium]